MSYLTHIRKLQNVHELVFFEASRRACQYIIQVLNEAFQQANLSPHILLDMRQSGLLPLAYLAQELRCLFSNYPQHPLTRLALVIDNPQLLKMSQYLLSYSLHQEDVAYFTEIETARLWLSQP